MTDAYHKISIVDST